MKYNDLNVPPLIRTDRIISAFANPVDYRKVEDYALTMQIEMLSHSFPPIKGYPFIISEEDTETGECFMNGNPIEAEHIGQIAWKVTDGHHRTLAAIEANLPHLEVELDYSCITDQKELAQFN